MPVGSDVRAELLANQTSPIIEKKEVQVGHSVPIFAQLAIKNQCQQKSLFAPQNPSVACAPPPIAVLWREVSRH